MTNTKRALFWPVGLFVLLADVVTKRVVTARITEHAPVEVIGDWVRLSLTYNQGAAFGLSLGGHSNTIFAILAAVALVIIYRIYRSAETRSPMMVLGLAAVAGGALSNLLDRVRWTGGVVDFIDVGIGAARFWTFNVADAAVTCGALALLFAEWRRSVESRDTSKAPLAP